MTLSPSNANLYIPTLSVKLSVAIVISGRRGRERVVVENYCKMQTNSVSVENRKYLEWRALSNFTIHLSKELIMELSFQGRSNTNKY